MVGAGAAGLMAAARLGEGTLVLDANPKPGRKLCHTGNGRCNLTNLIIDPARYHGDPAAASLLAAYPAQRVLAAFEGMGLLTKADAEGRVYPRNFQAAAVLDALWASCQEAGVEALWEFQAVRVRRDAQGFHLDNGHGKEVLADRLVLAAGGKASPRHTRGGEDWPGGYGLAQALGHSVTELTPSLAPLKTDPRRTRPLKGQRCRARASLRRDGEEIAGESGEVIFGDDRISGICVFDLSAWLRENDYIPGREGWTISLDLLEDQTPEEVLAYCLAQRERFPGRPAGALLAGAVTLRVGQELVASLGIPKDLALGGLTDRDLEQAAQAAKDWSFPILGRGDWDAAQVTAGGVPLEEIYLATMRSKRCPNLYLLGEMLDVDGECGGYNLHWAWSTALRFAESL